MTNHQDQNEKSFFKALTAFRMSRDLGVLSPPSVTVNDLGDTGEGRGETEDSGDDVEEEEDEREGEAGAGGREERVLDSKTDRREGGRTGELSDGDD